ncbi:5319_t:CDS:2 [Ambispora leptoticha]|uniref:5319_t:CDS:1 n=1 Tax=Ambispora leptoticha TaxID=144679 RepID=A0A9N8ZGS0_9GLOM|nr:5319_t:CDS:2 [Ambispora leptoticha]
MWSFATGQKPFAEKAHDVSLEMDVCNRIRPKEIENAPKCFSDLMKRCWAFDTKLRPTAFELNETFIDWMTDIYENPAPTEISEEFNNAEERRLDPTSEAKVAALEYLAKHLGDHVENVVKNIDQVLTTINDINPSQLNLRRE